MTLQGGTVRVESPWTTAHSGTRFVVTLPYRLVSAAEPALTSAHEAAADPPPDEPETPVVPDERPLVLVVEDNADLRAFISQAVAPFGRVLTADDGLAGWERALAAGPDLIISDVLMPRLDGYTLCQRLKQDWRTSHIPVILLTAKVTLENRLRGLTEGADEYLAKPFYVAELQLRVHNLLERQRRQRDWVRAQWNRPATAVAPPAPGERVPVEPDREDAFLEALAGFMAQHLDEAGFGVEELARAMGLSRVHLYRKVKALSGLTATEWLRHYRLKQATRLLEAGCSVSDAADQVGFESPAYFAKCFRALYGLTPTEFQHRPPEGPVG